MKHKLSLIELRWNGLCLHYEKQTIDFLVFSSLDSNDDRDRTGNIPRLSTGSSNVNAGKAAESPRHFPHVPVNEKLLQLFGI